MELQSLVKLQTALQQSKDSTMQKVAQDLMGLIVIGSMFVFNDEPEASPAEKLKARLSELAKRMSIHSDQQIAELGRELTGIIEISDALSPVVEAFFEISQHDNEADLGEYGQRLLDRSDFLDELETLSDINDFAKALNGIDPKLGLELKDFGKEIDELVETAREHEDCDELAEELMPLAPPVIWVVQECLKDHYDFLVAAGEDLTKINEARKVIDELEPNCVR